MCSLGTGKRYWPSRPPKSTRCFVQMNLFSLKGGSSRKELVSLLVEAARRAGQGGNKAGGSEAGRGQGSDLA
jgi:hypothetical protein